MQHAARECRAGWHAVTTEAHSMFLLTRARRFHVPQRLFASAVCHVTCTARLVSKEPRVHSGLKSPKKISTHFAGSNFSAAVPTTALSTLNVRSHIFVRKRRFLYSAAFVLSGVRFFMPRLNGASCVWRSASPLQL